MESLKAGDLGPGMVLKDSSKNVYLVVSKPGEQRKLLMIRAETETPVLIGLDQVENWEDMELSKDTLDWGHLRNALLDWEYYPAYSAALTLGEINKIFGTEISLDTLLKRKRRKRSN